MAEITEGSVVQLKSGSRMWTVGRIFDHEKLGPTAHCVADNGEHEEFPLVALEHAESAAPMVINPRLPGRFF